MLTAESAESAEKSFEFIYEYKTVSFNRYGIKINNNKKSLRSLRPLR